MVEPYKPIYTVKEVAKILKVNPSKVYELIRAGKLICLRLGQIKIRGECSGTIYYDVSSRED